MISELLLASQSVQALETLLKSANGLANYNEIVAKVSEVNSKLIAANAVALTSQEKQSSLARQVEDLEKENKRLKEWQCEAGEYVVQEVASGIFAYVRKNHAGPLPSEQKLCANCFNRGIKSILQQQRIEVGRQLSLVCHSCRAEVVFRNYREDAQQAVQADLP